MVPSGATSNRLVLDASVLVELVIAGKYADQAAELLCSYQSSNPPTLITAAHGPVETANAIRKLVLREWITAEEGQRSLRWLANLKLVLDPPSPRLSRIWELRDRMSAYDAAYAAAAEAHEAPLITTDSALLKACEATGVQALHLDADSR